MKKILMTGFALMSGWAAFGPLPAQEPPAVPPPKEGVKGTRGRGSGPAPIAYLPVPQLTAASKVVTGAPYSAVAVNETTQTLADGNRIVRSSQQNIYRDSQGRERSEGSQTTTVLGRTVTGGNISISDPVAGVSYTLNPGARTARQVNRVGGAGRGRGMGAPVELAAQQFEMQLSLNFSADISAGASAPLEEKLPAATMEGVFAQGTRTTTTIPAGSIGNERDIQVVDEVWYSPDLQMNVMTRHSDPRSGETVYKLTNISRAEPDASLFRIPAGYAVTDPSNNPLTLNCNTAADVINCFATGAPGEAGKK